MLLRAILPEWAHSEHPRYPKVRESDFFDAQILELIDQNYNLYWLPNHPKAYDSSKTIDGTHIDVFEYVFVDMDMKSGVYGSKQLFVDTLLFGDLPPCLITDSGNGIHAFWRVADLDGISYLRLQRRLCRKFNTDKEVSKIFQLMRLPESINFKIKDDPKPCVKIHESETQYTCEQLDKWLPTITRQDEEYCKRHYDQTYQVNQEHVAVDDKLPLKFQKLLATNEQVRLIFEGKVEDRSESDFLLGQILKEEGFRKKEALSVLVNCKKASTRAPIHRFRYAGNIADKLWGIGEEKTTGELSFLSDKEQLADFENEDFERIDSNENSLPFLDPIFDNYFSLSNGVTLMGARTGGGKSTVCYGMIANILRKPDFHKKILMISNEATRWEVLSNVACLLLKLDWKRDWNTKYRRAEVTVAVKAKISWILKRLAVVATSDGKGDCSDLSYIKQILSHAESYKDAYALVILDYLQTVERDSCHPKKAHWEVLKQVGQEMRKHSQSCRVPTVIFAQLADQSDNRKAFGQRIEGDRTFLNHCHNALEIVPDYDTQTTTIKARKLRYGDTPTWGVELKFESGRLFSSQAKSASINFDLKRDAS